MSIEKLIKELKIKKGDKLLVSSNIIKLIIYFKKKKTHFNPNYLINLLKKEVGNKGTLLFPTFNWDFCKGKTFDYNRSISQTGSLSNIALKRNDFVRSKNPIYSFAVTGHDKEKICNLDHEDCFGLNSPFGYLLKNKGKHLFIDLNWRLTTGINSTGFIFQHVAEQKAKVDYRYFITFKANYVNKNKTKKIISIRYFARNLDLKYSVYMKKNLSNFFLKNRILKKKKFNNINFELIDLAKAIKVLTKDLISKRKFFYKKKS